MTAKPTIIVITNRKGGTGKTTTAVNLAAEFAASGERTLLIDLDTQGHCALGLGLKIGDGQPTAHSLFGAPEAAAGMALTDAIVQTGWERLDLVPGAPDFRHDTAPNEDQILVRALSDPAIVAGYDRILIDSPPSLDRLLLSALAAAHWALIPFVPHPLSNEGVRQLARVFFRVAMSSNADLRLLGLLPVMLDPRIVQHRRVREQVIGQFGQARLLGGIRNDIKLAEAFAVGRPIRDYAPSSRGNQDYQTAFSNLHARLLG